MRLYCVPLCSMQDRYGALLLCALLMLMVVLLALLANLCLDCTHSTKEGTMRWIVATCGPLGALPGVLLCVLYLVMEKMASVV